MRSKQPMVFAMFCLSIAAPAAGQAEAAFLFLVGSDTLGIERFVSSGQLVTGEVTMRGQPRMAYAAVKDAPGSVASLDIIVYPANSGPDAAPQQRAHLRMAGDTALAEITAAGRSQTQRLPTQRGAFLLLNSSIALIEAALERLSEAGADTVSFPILLSAGGQTLPASLRRVRPDSIVMRIGPQESHLAVDGDRLLRLHNAAQRLVVQRVEGDAVARLTLGKPDYSPPPGAPYGAEDVKIPTRAGHVLAGTLTIPAGVSGRAPAVVTISGSGPQDRDESLPFVPGFRPFRQVADTLGRRGVMVLRFDDRGTGESTGDHAASTSADFADDVRAAVEWLRARPDVDPDRIALLGHSEGGMIAPMVAATDPRLAGIVLMAGPSRVGREIIDFQIRYGIDQDSTIAPAKRDSAFAAAKVAFDSAAANQPWMRFFLTHDPLPTIQQVRVPVLVLQGATDQQVTADQAEALGAALRAAGNGDVTVRILADRNHLFLPDPIGNPAGYVRLESGRIGPDVMGIIADWLTTRLLR